MKKIELSDEAYAALERLAATRNLSPAETITSLLAGDPLMLFLTGPDFAALPDPTGRYLALLGWCAQNYAGDFADFISHQASGLHYLTFNRDEINETRLHNQARHIAGTPYWAVMTISDHAKHRFVCQLLEFVGCHDETVAQAGRAIGFAENALSGFRLLSA